MTVCEFCREPVDPHAATTYTRVIGWERKASSTSRRGGSDIVLREQKPLFACGGCIEAQKLGVNNHQGALL